MSDDSLLHPVQQVYFRAGLIACREYMARFVEAESPSIAMSIRANWWPSLGEDFGPPRQLDFAEVTGGEYGAPDFRIKNTDEVSPTQEALPIALGFLQQVETGSVSAQRSERLDSDSIIALGAKWLRLADQQMQWSRESAARQDGANSHTERARARIYRECAADLTTLTGWPPKAGSGTSSLSEASSLNEQERSAEERFLPPSKGWQPISSAPKDGTQVILLLEDGSIVRAEWADCGDVIGWRSAIEDQHPNQWYGDFCYDDSEQPTHWMPLPLPPEALRSVEIEPK